MNSTAKDPPCKKIFVGGLDTNLTQDEIADHFSKYGKVELVELPYDKVKNQRRAFGFISFDSEDVVEQLCQSAKIPFGDKMLDVRKALTKEQQEAMAFRGGRGGGPMRAGFRGRARGAYGGPGVHGYDYNGMYGGYGGYDYYGGYYGSGYGGSSHLYDHTSMGGYGDGGYGYQSNYGEADSLAAGSGQQGGPASGKPRRGTWQADSNATAYHPYNR